MVVLQQTRHKHMSRGNASMKNIIKNPTIVETYKFGNSTVRIASDCIRTDPEEIQKVLDDWNRARWAIIDNLVEKGIGEGRIWIRSGRGEEDEHIIGE